MQVQRPRALGRRCMQVQACELEIARACEKCRSRQLIIKQVQLRPAPAWTALLCGPRKADPLQNFKPKPVFGS